MFKKSYLLLVLPILFFMTSVTGYSQQDVFFPVNKGGKKQKQKLRDVCFDCWAGFDKENNYEYLTFPYPVEIYGSNLDTLKQNAKEMIIQFAYNDFREHTLGARDVMINHAEQFIQLKFDDYVVPTRKRKEKKKGKYKIFIEEARVNKKLITCLCKAIDQYMSDNLVVLYKPDAKRKKEDNDIYEEARARLQAEYVNQEYKRTSCQNLDIQPTCEIKETDASKVNYYRELIQCTNRQKGIDAKIAVVVRDIIIKNTESKQGGIYESIVEIHFQAFNTNTNSFVMDEYFKDVAYSKTAKGSIENCIQKIVKKETRKLMHEEAEKYYNSCQDGKDFYIFIPDSYQEIKIMEFSDNLREISCIRVTNENKTENGTEIKCETYIPLQADIMYILRRVKPDNMGRIIPRAEYFNVRPLD